ncbi:hypothetical protein CHL67_06600 [Prosthecochloris sp. GSB1]|uniref:hypothetical protein n=1 Tax=Prosthecochloris sp. GSB1 TaxID=281093 RepID=UPI000B8CB2E9|nr:hypothetical protein [Prosthecochloris sp. GSB1]ASQ90638.1 hypothetical protein CHL67_06600 [Prosthecochloris sp. GSB1]
MPENRFLRAARAATTLAMLSACLSSPPVLAAGETRSRANSVVETRPLRLRPSGHIPNTAGSEISGLARSTREKNLYWAINDSGNPPEILPLRANGEIASVSGRGIRIPSAGNIDWESLAIDASGNIYVCDVGNNFSLRKLLRVYIVPEPSPAAASTGRPKVVDIRYPDENGKTPQPLVHDCEAAFFFRGKLFLLTKRLQDATTALYSLDTIKAGVNTLTRKDSFPIGGYVTAADMSPDGKILAVLTYNTLWLFHDFRGNDFFGGEKTAVPLEGGGQIESIVFSGYRSLLLVNETRNEIFSVIIDPRERSARQ